MDISPEEKALIATPEARYALLKKILASMAGLYRFWQSYRRAAQNPPVFSVSILKLAETRFTLAAAEYFSRSAAALKPRRIEVAHLKLRTASVNTAYQ